MEWVSRFLTKFYKHFFLGALYVLLAAFFIGEMHPFTRYPMFSYLPEKVRLYYMADEQGNFIPSVTDLHFKNDELQDWIEAYLVANQANWDDPVQMKIAAESVMNDITKKYIPTQHPYKEIAIVKVDITLKKDTVLYDTLVLSKRTFPTAN